MPFLSEDAVEPVASSEPAVLLDLDVRGAADAGGTFLVRCWQSDAHEPDSWRFMVRPVGGDRPRRVFAHPEEMIAYLIDLASSTPPAE